MVTTTSIRSMVDNKTGTMNRTVFSDKDIYQQELEQVFGRCWLFIGTEYQVKNNNDFFANYMGEDPILLTRDGKGKLHAFLNMCRHRGNRICRADAGNAPSFMCTYHGWTFATDGKLVGVPGYKEAYFEELDRSQWGLVEAGQLDTSKGGLVFATWDKSAPSLKDYLGDMAWYMDMAFDRTGGGIEVLPGTHRWVLSCNWKLGADNFAGDGYHTYLTHASMQAARGNGPRPGYFGQGGWSMTPGNGHGTTRVASGQGFNNAGGAGLPDIIAQYHRNTLPETRKRLGDFRANTGSTGGVFTVFPNFSHQVFMRNWHPRGPDKTEVWSWCFFEKDASPEVKEAVRLRHTWMMGPSGNQDQDDMNNWLQCTAIGKSPKGKTIPLNQQLGLNHDTKVEGYPGTANLAPSEVCQREFYTFWAQLMDAPSWNQVKLAPRTLS